MRVSVDLQRIATGLRDVIIADNDADLVRAMTFLDGQAADMDGAAADYLKCSLADENRKRFVTFQEKYGTYLEDVRELSAKAERGDRELFASALKALRSQAQGLQASIGALTSTMDVDALKQSKAAGSSVALARRSSPSSPSWARPPARAIG